MNCQLFETVINDLARASVMDASLRDRALAHSQSCERCAARLRDERMLTEGLRKVNASADKREAPARVEASLLAAFREQHSPARNQVKARPRARWAIAAAAAVLILLALVSLRIQSARVTTVETAKEIGPEPAAPATQKNLTPPLKDDLAPRGARAHQLKPDRKPVAAQARIVAQAQRRPAGRNKDGDGLKPQPSGTQLPEIATDFMPLVEGDNLSLMESGQVVRVELPRSALISLGLPMNMERADERIKADVVVGNDGLARAIRFVR